MRRWWTVRVLVALTLLVAGAAFERTTPIGGAATRRPNIVVVMTDDQTLEEMRFLPRTRALIGEEGTTFTNSFVNYSLCCPSRSTFLTGQYMHNHGVVGNVPPDGGYGKLNHANALPVWLREAGYNTALVGKYLNGYGSDDPHERPPGWTEWYGLVDPTTYHAYDYKMNRNGVVKQYGGAPDDYQTDVLADTAVDVVRRRAAQAAPFFMWVTPLAPHKEGNGDPIPPAPRHRGRYADLALPRPANFDEADVNDKPSPVSRLDRLNATQIQEITTAYRHEAAALLAVDEMVERIHDALQAKGELDDTVFVFTSDNGFFHGEHRIPKGKARIYDEASQVPLLVRGPGFAQGARVGAPVINADLAPTFVDLAEATAGRTMDGRTLLDRDPDRALLFEAGKAVAPFEAIRAGRWLWAEYEGGGRELYDVVADPDQLRSRDDDPSLASLRASLADRLDRLRTCKGAACRNG